MKKSFYLVGLLFVFIVTFVLGSSIISFADDPPAGSYKKTCKEAEYDGTNLKATCKKFDGSYASQSTLSNADTCTGDRENCNGTLKCTGVDLPSGNYKNSCFCCYKKYILNTQKQREIENVCCLCKNGKGKYQSETCTPCEDDSCTSPKQIQNNDGTLTCKQ